ncbi:hypothetical protein MTO96_041032 [Rhipicephalus appendiculatus]
MANAEAETNVRPQQPSSALSCGAAPRPTETSVGQVMCSKHSRAPSSDVEEASTQVIHPNVGNKSALQAIKVTEDEDELNEGAAASAEHTVNAELTNHAHVLRLLPGWKEKLEEIWQSSRESTSATFAAPRGNRYAASPPEPRPKWRDQCQRARCGHKEAKTYECFPQATATAEALQVYESAKHVRLEPPLESILTFWLDLRRSLFKKPTLITLVKSL